MLNLTNFIKKKFVFYSWNLINTLESFPHWENSPRTHQDKLSLTFQLKIIKSIIFQKSTTKIYFYQVKLDRLVKSYLRSGNQYYDGCEVSRRPSFLESDRPCFWIGPSLFWHRPSVFRVRPSHQTFPFFQVSPSHFSTQTFPFFYISPSHFSTQTFSFSESDLPIFSGQSFLLFQVSSSHFSTQSFPFLWVSPSHFSSQTFPFFRVSPSHFSKSVLLIFRVRPPCHFLDCVLLAFAYSVFPFDRYVHCWQN